MVMLQSPVRYIGSRELHRDLPKVLESLEEPLARCVLTIHGKPKAVMIGAEAFLALVRGASREDRVLALQLAALVGGLVAATPPPDAPAVASENRRPEFSPARA